MSGTGNGETLSCENILTIYFVQSQTCQAFQQALKQKTLGQRPSCLLVSQLPNNDVKIERSMVRKMHNQLTKQDIKRMEEEIEHRKLVVRKEALEAVKEARAHGDLSENFE